MWSEADRKFTVDEYNEFAISDQDLRKLLACGANKVVNDTEASALVVLSQIFEMLRAGKPYSLVRVGDGEGNALGVLRSQVLDIHWRVLRARFAKMAHCDYTQEEALAVCRSVRLAIINADFVGFRSVDATVRGDELPLIRKHIRDGNVVGALGILYAREFFATSLRHGLLLDKIIASAWVHLALHRHLKKIIEEAPAVIVISGQPSLETMFRSLLGRRLRRFICLPAEGSFPQDADQSHLRGIYPQVVREIKESDLSRTLVLAGAGYFGKIYCDLAKQNGGVAIDMGSIFDVLVGKFTRPAHQSFRFDADLMR